MQNSAEVLEENNYYPFGLKYQGYDILEGNPAYQCQYNGKELQGETGWNDYGWRQYMPEIGRWNGMDQLAETYDSYSPYAYVMNNPVVMFDPDRRVTDSWVRNFYNMSFGNNVTWTNTGNGFESSENVSVNYEGTWLSMNADSDGIADEHRLPLVWVGNPSNITWARQALGYQQIFC